MVSGRSRIWQKNVLAVKYRSLTHAYVLNRKFAERIVKEPWRKIAYDSLLKSVQESYFALWPSFAFQSNSSSENRNYLWLDKIRRCCGGLARIQRRNEFFHRYRPVFITLHAAIALLLAVWILT